MIPLPYTIAYALRVRALLPFLAAVVLFSCSEPVRKSREAIRDVQSENEYSDNLRLKAINEEIASEATNPIPWSKRAEFYLKEGDPASGIRDAKEALRLDSNRTNSYVLLASAYRAGKRLDSAAICINRAKRRGYSSPELYLSSGEILLIAQRYDAALDELNESIRLAPQNAKAHFFKGMVYEEKGDTAHAIRDYNQAVSIDPEFADGHNKLAMLYMRRHRYDLARQHLESGLRFAPRDAFVNFNFGIFYLNQNQPDSARSYFKKAVFFEPSMYLANYQLGMFSYRERNYLDAANRLESCLQYNNKLVDARFYLALCRENLGSYPEAVEQYRAVVNQNQGFVKDAQKGIARIEGHQTRRQIQEEDAALADTTE